MHEEVGRFALYTYLAAVSVQEARSFLQLFPPLQDDSHLSSTLKRFDGKRYVSEADGVDGDPGSGRPPCTACPFNRRAFRYVPDAFALTAGPVKRQMAVRE